jgi:hypothetical protein
MNRSFCISDGRATCFVKLTAYEDIQRGLARWRKCADILASQYHAPEMVGWLDVEGSPFCGPVFEWIDGNVIASLDDFFARDISTVIQRLHRDTELVARIMEDGATIDSCARAYRRGYHDRFVEDLAFIDEDPPPFVRPELRAYLRGEAELLAKMVGESAAFQELANQPVHADLWLNNTLVDTASRWYILDWDGLTLGDPVMDWTMLFGPTRDTPHEVAESIVTRYVSLARAEQERLNVYARAALLDWVIDPLSDWVASVHEPEHGTQMRAANERVHKRALARYRQVYGVQ